MEVLDIYDKNRQLTGKDKEKARETGKHSG